MGWMERAWEGSTQRRNGRFAHTTVRHSSDLAVFANCTAISDETERSGGVPFACIRRTDLLRFAASGSSDPFGHHLSQSITLSPGVGDCRLRDGGGGGCSFWQGLRFVPSFYLHQLSTWGTGTDTSPLLDDKEDVIRLDCPDESNKINSTATVVCSIIINHSRHSGRNGS